MLKEGKGEKAFWEVKEEKARNNKNSLVVQLFSLLPDSHNIAYLGEMFVKLRYPT